MTIHESEPFSLWQTPTMFKIIRISWLGTLIGLWTWTLWCTITLMQILWIDCPIEFHVPLNDTTTVYEKSFKTKDTIRYNLAFSDRNSTNFEESEKLLNEIEFRIKVFKNNNKLADFITDSFFNNVELKDKRLINNTFVQTGKIAKKFVAYPTLEINNEYHYSFQLLKVPSQFPKKKEIVIQVINDPLYTFNNPAWDEGLFLSIALKIFLIPVTLILTLITYKNRLNKINKSIFPILLIIACFIIQYFWRNGFG